MKKRILISIALLSSLALAGCGIAPIAYSTPAVVQGSLVNGKAMGGQQPVANATVQIYATGSSGYGSASTALITPSSAGANYPITTGSTGYFTITPSEFNCPTPSSTPVYMVITGGNEIGTGTNSNLALMAALGPCSGLSGISFVNVNEITTVASVWALAPFMSAYDHIGTTSTNALGLTNAFSTVNELVNIATGQPSGPSLPSGATLPVQEIDALADILASCVNSTGGVATNTATNCGTLFYYATPGSTAPTNTIDAAMDIAQNPTLNIGNLFGLVTAAGSAFATTETQPTSFTIAINYTGGGLSQPTAIAADESGDIWTTNTNNSVSKLGPTGAAISGSSGITGGSMSVPWAIAIDASGDAWVANSTANYITYISSSTSTVTGYTGNGLNKPKGIAIDSVGNVWAANSGTNYISAFTSTGTAITYYTGGGLSKPIALAVNPQ